MTIQSKDKKPTLLLALDPQMQSVPWGRAQTTNSFVNKGKSVRGKTRRDFLCGVSPYLNLLSWTIWLHARAHTHTCTHELSDALRISDSARAAPCTATIKLCCMFRASSLKTTVACYFQSQLVANGSDVMHTVMEKVYDPGAPVLVKWDDHLWLLSHALAASINTRSKRETNSAPPLWKILLWKEPWYLLIGLNHFSVTCDFIIIII